MNSKPLSNFDKADKADSVSSRKNQALDLLTDNEQ